MVGGKERINGETITGIALVFLAGLFIWAASANAVWATIVLAAYLIMAIGAGFIAIGVVTITRSNRGVSGHSGHY